MRDGSSRFLGACQKGTLFSGLQKDDETVLESRLRAARASGNRETEGACLGELGGNRLRRGDARGDIEVVSLISRTSAEKMGLKTGDAVTAVVKSTEVMVAKD